ncbi:hypothetical protein [Mycobacterium deserti]|uniref:Nitroreductase n=1 Tax=Mycobacterium deserti TaxID=2978347 RepID=A0ABT2MFZ3_9MYCO|nr:hypothetical protein [Mycobacterium deserti]MCT7660030.1 hypothetical protein [Mycobacterium deserti]
MPSRMSDSVFVRTVNAVAVALLDAPVVGRVLGRGLVKIRYVGRRSGQTFELPVGYRRCADGIVIGVAAPDAKTWWRNFLGDGGPITVLGLDRRDRIAHAVADRDPQGRVSVRVSLTR